MVNWEPAYVIDLAMVAFAALVAVLLISRDPKGEHCRWFAAFMALYALSEGLVTAAIILGNTAMGDNLHSASIGIDMLEMGALTWFMLIYPRRRRWATHETAIALTSVVSVLFITFALQPQFAIRYGGTEATYAAWLGWVTILTHSLPGVAALVFLTDLRREPDGPRRQVLQLLTIGFWAFAAFPMGRFLAVLTAVGVPTASAAISVWYTFALHVVQLALFGAGLLVAGMMMTERRSDGVRWMTGLSVLLAFGFFARAIRAGFWGVSPTPDLDRIGFVVSFATLPILAAYAILRCSMFDIRFKAKFVLRQSTFVTMAGVMFWFVSTVIGSYLEEFLLMAPPWPDIVAGAVVAIGIRPMQVLAQRFAERAMPGAKPASDMDDEERRHIYEEQVQLAWDDHVIGEKERRILDNLAERLRLAAADAMAIERRITGP